MTVDQLNEALAVLDTMLSGLLTAAPGGSGYPNADLFWAVGTLQAGAPAALQAGQLSAPLSNCFNLAITSGATLAGMQAIEAAMQAETPVGIPAQAVANAGVRYALIAESQILSNTTFTSSQDVFAALAAINCSFDAAQEYAADNQDPANYQALIALQSSVVQDLTTRAIYLPALVTYSFARTFTSHALSNRLYGTADRCDELRMENKIIHPAFMHPSGICLSE